MPEINVGGCRIHVEVEGPERAPVLVLSNSLATTLHMWDPQVTPITQHFRLVRYDPRGHGRSDVPAGPYTMQRLGRDVLAVLDNLRINRVSWCGLSMGGMVGQWLGANAPERIERLVLTNTSSYFADKADRDSRLKLVREKGIAAFAEANMERWFTKSFASGHRRQSLGYRRCSRQRPLKGISPAPKRSATWIIANYCRRLGCRHWSSVGTIRRLLWRQANTSRAAFPAPRSPCSMLRISPTSRRLRHTPMLC